MNLNAFCDLLADIWWLYGWETENSPSWWLLVHIRRFIDEFWAYDKSTSGNLAAIFWDIVRFFVDYIDMSCTFNCWDL